MKLPKNYAQIFDPNYKWQTGDIYGINGNWFKRVKMFGYNGTTVAKMGNHYSIATKFAPDEPVKRAAPVRYEEIKDDNIIIHSSFYYKFSFHKSYENCRGYGWVVLLQENKLTKFGEDIDLTIKQIKSKVKDIQFFRKTRKLRFKTNKPFPYGY